MSGFSLPPPPAAAVRRPLDTGSSGGGGGGASGSSSSSTSAAAGGEDGGARRKRSRWGDEEEKVNAPGVVLPSNLSADQQENYLRTCTRPTAFCRAVYVYMYRCGRQAQAQATDRGGGLHLVQLKIEEIGQRLRTGDVVPPDNERCVLDTHRERGGPLGARPARTSHSVSLCLAHRSLSLSSSLCARVARWVGCAGRRRRRRSTTALVAV